MKITKTLLKKASLEGSDPWKAVLACRNTPTEGLGSSPVQRLMSRRTRTLLPIRDTQLKPKMVQNVTESKQARGQTVKQHYDARARNMTALIHGQTVRVLLHPKDQDTRWSLGMCIDQLSERSYVVLLNGKTS